MCVITLYNGFSTVGLCHTLSIDIMAYVVKNLGLNLNILSLQSLIKILIENNCVAKATHFNIDSVSRRKT